MLSGRGILPAGEEPRGDLWTNMLRGKCKGTGRELLILGIMSEEEEMKKQWERQRLIKWGRRGQHCVQLRPLASSPVQDRPGSDGCSPAEKDVEHRRGSNRITPPLTQGSCLSEMLSLQAYVSIMPACVAMQYKKCCIYLSFNRGTYGVCQICQGEHIKMEQN